MSKRNPDRKFWSDQEDQLLQETVETFGRRWVEVAQSMSITGMPHNVLKGGRRLLLIEPKPVGHQRRIRYYAVMNCMIKQIKERFVNVLDPNINKGKFTEQEDMLIWRFTQEYGRKWTQLAELFKGRPENMIKNRYYSFIQGEYGEEVKPYLIAYKNGKSTQKRKKQFKHLLKKEVSIQKQEEGVQESVKESEQNESPAQTSCEEEEVTEESKQYSSRGRL